MAREYYRKALVGKWFRWNVDDRRPTWTAESLQMLKKGSNVSSTEGSVYWKRTVNWKLTHAPEGMLIPDCRSGCTAFVSMQRQQVGRP